MAEGLQKAWDIFFGQLLEDKNPSEEEKSATPPSVQQEDNNVIKT